MADVTLVLKADNSQYVNKLKQAQTETQKLYDYTTQGAGKAVNVVERELTVLNKLQEFKRKAAKEDLQYYNQAIEGSKKRLQMYEEESKAVSKVEKSGNSLLGSVGKWALGFASVAGAVNLLKDAFLATEQGLRALNVVGTVTKQVLYDIVKGNLTSISTMAQGIALALAANKEAERIRIKQREDIVIIAKEQTRYNELYFAASDQTKTEAERLTILNQAMMQHEVLMRTKIENAEEELTGIRMALAAAEDKTKLLDAEAQKLAEIETLRGESFMSVKRLESQRTGLIKSMSDEEVRIHKEALEAKFKQQEEFNKLSLKLIADYDKSQIESLTGVDKLRAQRAFGLKQLEEFRGQMEALGALTKEQEDMFAALGANVQKAFLEGLTKENFAKPETKNIFSDYLDKLLKPGGLIKPKPVEGKDEFSIWSLLGINEDTEDGQKQIEALTEAKDTMISVIDEVYAKRVEDAQRRRELLDTQIDETQQELESELELYEAGYASNVAAKKKELAELKKQRELALKKEEEAIKKQRQFDTIQQVSSLITASANIFKSLTLNNPAGVPIAIALIAAMFAAFAATKSRAAQATKLAHGGSGTDTGMITGKSHATGGERFLSQVEVERGEAWGVLSIPASQKFGKVFHHMVSSFNKGQIPQITTGKISNNVMVENSGPNSRLDQVVREQRKLNARLTGDSVQEFGNMKVIRKGSTTRVISK